MTEHGKIQHWQSSPHQQGNLTGFATPFAIDEAPLEVSEVVDGGMV